MKKLITLLITLPSFLITLNSCGEADEQQQEWSVSGEGISIEGAWARPASEGRMSAAYFLITNFEDEDDRLIGVRSDVARMVEIHESYEGENDMMGMREVPEIELPANETVRFEQGGLHIMLIQATRQLAEGDTFELTLEFENSGEQTIEVPIRN
ncbi:MAG: copper chaperone PCu(A)C [Balneolaceae bacterium]|nr:copper chaperone PCu(A)C [Balneolaceae bacterium]MCH8549201.1 copper chaperone PCu(A)C [Balneolaceae bacterium]